MQFEQKARPGFQSVHPSEALDLKAYAAGRNLWTHRVGPVLQPPPGFTFGDKAQGFFKVWTKINAGLRARERYGIAAVSTLAVTPGTRGEGADGKRISKLEPSAGALSTRSVAR